MAIKRGGNVNQPSKISNIVADVVVEKKEDIIASADVIERLQGKTQKFKRSEPKLENEVRHYRLLKEMGVTYMLPTSGFTIFDPETKTRREVRYAENESSIFKEEQGEFTIRKPIKFKMSELFVSSEYPALIKLLDMHYGNQKNGGSLFYRVDKVEESKKEVENDFAAADAIQMIRQKSLDELMPVVLHLGINTNQTTFEIKKDLLQFAKKDPNGFMKRFDSPLVKLKAIVQNAADFGILDIKEDGIYWFDSQKLILTNPEGKDARETMAVYLTTERGVSVLEELQRQLAEL